MQFLGKILWRPCWSWLLKDDRSVVWFIKTLMPRPRVPCGVQQANVLDIKGHEGRALLHGYEELLIIPAVLGAEIGRDYDGVTQTSQRIDDFEGEISSK